MPLNRLVLLQPVVRNIEVVVPNDDNGRPGNGTVAESFNLCSEGWRLDSRVGIEA